MSMQPHLCLARKEKVIQLNALYVFYKHALPFNILLCLCLQLFIFFNISSLFNYLLCPTLLLTTSPLLSDLPIIFRPFSLRSWYQCSKPYMFGSIVLLWKRFHYCFISPVSWTSHSNCNQNKIHASKSLYSQLLNKKKNPPKKTISKIISQFWLLLCISDSGKKLTWELPYCHSNVRCDLQHIC